VSALCGDRSTPRPGGVPATRSYGAGYAETTADRAVPPRTAGAANAYAGFTIRTTIDDRLDHGQAVADLELVDGTVYLSYGLAATLVVTIAFLAARRPWAQYSVYVTEALAIAITVVVMIATTSVSGLLGLVIAAVVLLGVSRPEVTEWLDPDPDDVDDPHAGGDA